MDRIHQRLGRLGFGAKRAMAISCLMQMERDPALRAQLAQVREDRKRKRKDGKGPSKGERTATSKRKVKDERRQKDLLVETEAVKDPSLKVSGHEVAKREAKNKS
jgi:hypothetical protein